MVLVLTVGIFTWFGSWFLEVWECLLFTSVVLSHNDVDKLLLILSCANRKFDNLMSSANSKISHFLYKGLTEGHVWWLCIGAKVELDNSTEIWIWSSYEKMPQWLKPLFSGGSGGGIPKLQEVEVLGQKHFSEKCIKYLWVSIFRLDHPLTICIMLYTCSYIFFLMAARLIISFNEHSVCIFALSYLGGKVSLSIKSWERCIKFSISIPILIISVFVCALV